VGVKNIDFTLPRPLPEGEEKLKFMMLPVKGFLRKRMNDKHHA
jgi:hypothetical protein